MVGAEALKAVGQTRIERCAFFKDLATMAHPQGPVAPPQVRFGQAPAADPTPVAIARRLNGLKLGEQEGDIADALCLALAANDEIVGAPVLGRGVVKNDDVAAPCVQLVILQQGEEQQGAGSPARKLDDVRVVPVLRLAVS